MPRDLFGDVVRSRISIGSRKWYTVPLSLAAHVAAIVPLVLVPLLATDVLPIPYDDNVYIPVAPPPPEPPRPVTPRPATPQQNPNAAPLDAPSEIRPETGLELEPFDRVETGIDPLIDSVVSGAPPEPPPVAVAPPPLQEPVRPGGTVRRPMKVRDAAPVYPIIAQTARVEGTVILEALIDRDGRVQQVKVLRSVNLLDQAAVDAVKQWEYSPTLLNGVPVPVLMTVTVTFSLRK